MKNTAILVWAYIAVMLCLLVNFGSPRVNPMIQVGGQVPMAGSAGQNITEQPYLGSSEFLIANDTPFSASLDKWHINSAELTSGWAFRTIDVATVNLTEVTCSARVKVIQGLADVALDVKCEQHLPPYGSTGRLQKALGGSGDTVTLNLQIPRQDLAEETPSPVVSLTFLLGASDSKSAVIQVLGFSIVGSYKGTLSPVAFQVLTTEGESLCPEGNTARLRFGDVDVNITNEELGIAFDFGAKDFFGTESVGTLILPAGNYSGICCWSSWYSPYSGSNVSVAASVRSNTSLV